MGIWLYGQTHTDLIPQVNINIIGRRYVHCEPYRNTVWPLSVFCIRLWRMYLHQHAHRTPAAVVVGPKKRTTTTIKVNFTQLPVLFYFSVHFCITCFFSLLLFLASIAFSKLVFIVVGVVVAWLVAFLFVKSFCARCIYIVHFSFIDRD